jgi:hypothetical protein
MTEAGSLMFTDRLAAEAVFTPMNGEKMIARMTSRDVNDQSLGNFKFPKLKRVVAGSMYFPP